MSPSFRVLNAVKQSLIYIYKWQINRYISTSLFRESLGSLIRRYLVFAEVIGLAAFEKR